MYFSPTPCDVDTAKLDQAAEDALNIVARITGKSGDLKSLFDDGAKEFSELIAEDIYSVANENHGAWTSALATCWHVWGVLTKWSGDVERYKANIAGLQQEWDTAVANNFGFEPDDGGVVEFRRALASSLNDRANGYWKTLEEEAEDNSSNLEGGPTVANLRELVDAGVLGFAAYNATRQILYYPSTFDTGERDGEAMLPYLTGEKDLDDEYYRLIEQLAVLNALAADAKRNGEQLRDFQLEYLEEFYAALDKAAEDGVVGIPDQLNGEHLSDSEREEVMGTLGDGLLVLSDEATGGSYDALPQSVHDVIAGPGEVQGHGAGQAVLDWQSKAAGLAELFTHTDAALEAGAEFSTRLMTVAANEVDRFAFLEESNGVGDSVMSTFLDVATRNNDANYALITGEYPEGVEAPLPWDEDSPEDYHVRLMERLYTHDWGDGGEAVRGTTDWIADVRVDESIRDEALVAFMKSLEDEKFQDSIFGTGESVTDDDGTTWNNVSAGHLNPQFADSLADIFIEYEEAFANTDGISGNVPIGGGAGVELTDVSRALFTQLAVGDPDAASRIYSEALMRTAEAMEAYSNGDGGGEFGEGQLDGAYYSASLQSLVEVALMNESSFREASDQEYADYRNKVSSTVIDILSGPAGDVGVSGVTVELAKFVAGEAFNVSGDSANPRVGIDGDWVKTERMWAYAVGVAANQDPDLMNRLEGEKIAKMDDSGSLYVPPDHTDWGDTETDKDLGNLYNEIKRNDWPNGDGNIEEAVGSFVDAFDITSQKWEELLVEDGELPKSRNGG